MAVKDKKTYTISSGKCTVCDRQIAATDGIRYAISDDGTYAEVIDYTASAKDVVIADEYEGVPVTKIRAAAFRYKSITSVLIPNSVTTIGQ